MSHVAPHEWAELADGLLSDARADKLTRHAAGCERCAAARDQVAAARSVFGDIRATEAPSLPWDHIGARIYWANSSARHRSGRSARSGRGRRLRFMPLFFMGTAAVAAAAVAAAWLSLGGGSDEPVAVGPAKVAVGVASTTPELAPTTRLGSTAQRATPLSGVVVFARGDVQVNGAPLAFDKVIEAGATIDTRSGQVTIQFDQASGFTAGPETQVDVRAFDAEHVELVVRGDIFVDVAHDVTRKANRRVRVLAGDRVVEVRGTAFHVGHRNGRLDVSCSRGQVVVKSARHEVSVGAGHRLRLGDQEPVGALRAHPISAEYRSQLANQTRLPMLPAWVGASALFRASSTLDVKGPARSAVRVDGVVVGTGKFSMRVMSGRHHVERAGADGRWRAGKWVELAAGQTRVAPALPRARVGRVGARRARTAELSRALGSSGRINRCMMPLRKQGLASGSFIVFDIGITAAGNVDHLNIVETNLPTRTARCVRDAVDMVSFVRGPAAAVRHRLSF